MARTEPNAYVYTDPFSEQQTSWLDRITGTARRARIRAVEGPRGAVTRAQIQLRYLMYGLAIVLVCATVHAALTHFEVYQAGGKLLLVAQTLMVAVAAGGSLMYPMQRESIIEEFRHFAFGLCLWPAALLAGVICGIQAFLVQPSAQKDSLVQMLSTGVPLVFLFTVIVPPVVFMKVVSGAQTLAKSNMDDEDLLSIYSRQDGRQF